MASISPRGARRAAAPRAGSELRQRCEQLGLRLAKAWSEVLGALPDAPLGTQKLATLLGVDKVLTSRLLKALRQREPLAVLQHLPGPEPLRRALHGASRFDLPKDPAREAAAAVDDFERLIREEAGDRSALGAVLAAWLPEVRAEFELRRKQAAFKAISELKGAAVELDFSVVLVLPSRRDARMLDIIWVIGKLGLKRLRPEVQVKFATRRLAPSDDPRRPLNLDGEEIEGLGSARLDEFCRNAPAPVEARRAGETVHYLLGETGFGPHSAVDVVFCELNREELPASVPPGSGRQAFFFADVDTPARRLLFDVLLHRDVYPGSDAVLHVYDTAGSGPADPNDRSRDVDRLEVSDGIEALEPGLGTYERSEVPGFAGLLEHVLGKAGVDPADLRGYRCRIDYPIYGSQVVQAFRAPERDGD